MVNKYCDIYYVSKDEMKPIADAIREVFGVSALTDVKMEVLDPDKHGSNYIRVELTGYDFGGEN